jgi:hypothetical protein
MNARLEDLEGAHALSSRIYIEAKSRRINTTSKIALATQRTACDQFRVRWLDRKRAVRELIDRGCFGVASELSIKQKQPRDYISCLIVTPLQSWIVTLVDVAFTNAIPAPGGIA